MASALTTAADLIVPEVWGDAVMTTALTKAVMVGLSTTDDTLVGQPGDTIHFPKFAYIGDADDLTEGVAMDTTALSMTDSEASIKEAGKAIELTDTAVLTALGNPQDNARNQLGLSIARKLDADLRSAAEDTSVTSPLSYQTGDVFSWAVFTAALATMGDEYDPAELAGIVLHSTQHVALLNDANFLSADKVGGDAVMRRGFVGNIGSVPVFVSDRATAVTDAAGDSSNVAGHDVLIIRQGALALSYKRRAIVETDRDILKRTNLITTNVHYAAHRIDDSGIIVVSVADAA